MIQLLFLIPLISGSYYDPHVFPVQGPFFEGWYMRMSVSDSPYTYGFLFGKVLPKNIEDIVNPNYISVVRSKGDGSTMEAYDVFPRDYKITIGGKEVTENPDKNSAPKFEMHSEFGYFKILNEFVEWDFDFPDISFKGTGNGHVRFRNDGYGPATWTEIFPLPLHWYVFSVGTRIQNFEFKNKKNLMDSQQGDGFMHMEKNWGVSFPSAWIWAQGHNPENEATVLTAGGPLPGPIPLVSHLVSYINNKKNIFMSFAPQNSVITSTESNNESNCNGLTIEARSMTQYLKIEFTAKNSLFQTCLLGPSIKGFVGMATESYETQIKVEAQIMGLTGWYVVDEQTFTNAALEFGGDYICKKANPCQPIF